LTKKQGNLLRRLRRSAIFLPMLVGIYYLSYWLRFEGQIGREWQTFVQTVGWVVAVKFLVFRWFCIDEGWGRFVTFYDLVALIKAATVGLLLAVLVDYAVILTAQIPRSVILIDWGATVVLFGGIRASVRVYQERSWRQFLFPSNKTRALIVGANDAGESLLRAITRNEKLNYDVVGFVDDDSRVGNYIGGMPVIGTLDQTAGLTQRRGVAEILIPTGELSGRHVRQLIDDTRDQPTKVTVLPSYEQLINGQVDIQPRQVAIDDLLGREPVKLDLESIRHWIDDRVLLVTGSAGSIGSCICRQLLQFSPKKIVLVDRCETGQFFLERELRASGSGVELDVCIADILNTNRMRTLLAECKPDIIFHASAYKHVPLMENHPQEAVDNIVRATCNLVDMAVDCGVGSFVMTSTDKAVNPTSVMGACKRIAELYVQSLAGVSTCRFVTVRFGNVLDSAGSVVQVFREQIARGGPITITDPNVERFFMTIPEAARLVIQAGAIGNDGEILLLDMGEPVRIVDLATDMIRLSGLEPQWDIDIEFVGLRPGEKMFEELRGPGETELPTRHPKVFVSDCDRRDLREVIKAVDRLLQFADQHPELIVGMLREIVPEYTNPRQAALSQPRKAA